MSKKIFVVSVAVLLGLAACSSAKSLAPAAAATLTKPTPVTTPVPSTPGIAAIDEQAQAGVCSRFDVGNADLSTAITKIREGDGTTYSLGLSVMESSENAKTLLLMTPKPAEPLAADLAAFSTALEAVDAKMTAPAIDGASSDFSQELTSALTAWQTVGLDCSPLGYRLQHSGW